MKAMIFAAGIGSRLMPLTSKCPKALIPVNGLPMLQLIIQRIKKLGINHIVINTYHHSDKVKEFIQKNSFSMKIDSSEESIQLLNTGGGLKKASLILDANEPILIHNVDVFTDINLQKMINFHKETNAIATLAVRNRKTNRYLLFDESNRLIGWKNNKSKERILIRKEHNINNFAFSGIHIVHPSIFPLLPSKEVFSIIEAYLDIAKHHSICGYEHNEGTWIDAGKKEFLEPASNFVKSHKSLYF